MSPWRANREPLASLHGCAREGRIISAVGKFRPAAQRLSVSIAPVLISLCLVRLFTDSAQVSTRYSNHRVGQRELVVSPVEFSRLINILCETGIIDP